MPGGVCPACHARANPMALPAPAPAQTGKPAMPSPAPAPGVSKPAMPVSSPAPALASDAVSGQTDAPGDAMAMPVDAGQTLAMPDAPAPAPVSDAMHGAPASADEAARRAIALFERLRSVKPDVDASFAGAGDALLADIIDERIDKAHELILSGHYDDYADAWLLLTSLPLTACDAGQQQARAPLIRLAWQTIAPAPVRALMFGLRPDLFGQRAAQALAPKLRARHEGGTMPLAQAHFCTRCEAMSAPATLPAPADGLCIACRHLTSGQLPAGYKRIGDLTKPDMRPALPLAPALTLVSEGGDDDDNAC